MILDLTELKTGQKGVIVEVAGGFHFTKKIQSMGIRPGKEITKLSAQLWHGPQTIELDKMRIAVGYGMAKKIMIQVKT